MYDIKNKFLYEILDDYIDADEAEKKEIFKAFTKILWSCKNKRLISEKKISFKVLGIKDDEVKELFKLYSSIPYTHYKSRSIKTDYLNLIRQKVNNIYTIMCDGNVCNKKEYIDLLHTAKSLYYDYTINNKVISYDEIKISIEESLIKADESKEIFSKQKMQIEWNEYKKIINGYLEKIFNNFIPLDLYEDKSQIVLNIDTWTEDNFVVRYICKSLSGYMKNYQKQYYGVKRNCDYKYCGCGRLIEKQNNRSKYCEDCSKKIQFLQKKEWDNTKRNRNPKNRNSTKTA